MTQSQPTTTSPMEIARLLVVHPKRWLVPTAVIGLLAVGFAAVRPATWEASQALIVRNEAINNDDPGKFGHTDEMKTVQETILELARSHRVLDAALRQVGPPDDVREGAEAWPTAEDVADLRDAVTLAPPGGAEFGKTEVFYLKVKNHDRGRGVELNRAICDQLLTRFQQLRDTKGLSMIDELVKTVQLAQTDLDASTAELAAIEQRVGSDLAELRALEDAGAGDSAIRRTIVEIRAELRQIEATEEANRQLLTLLKAAEEDPGRLLATPNRLLESQPALRRLKDGLLDAQIKTAGLKGNMSDVHPLVQAARQSEEEMSQHLHNELAIAVRGLDVELQMNGNRQALLQNQLAEATGRLSELAGLRATYSNRIDENRNRAALVERAEQNLADARATHASATATSLISRIDAPDGGVHPVGLRRSMIALIGILGGLVTGLGVLFLTVSPAQPVEAAHAAEHMPAMPRKAAAVSHFDESDESDLTPDSRLSFKQALRKIAYSSRA